MAPESSYTTRVKARLAALEAVARACRPMVLIGPAGQLRYMTPAARTLFGEIAGRAQCPKALLDLALEARRSRRQEARDIAIGDRSFAVRCDVVEGGLVVLVLEDLEARVSGLVHERCRAFGLSARECEVAAMVARGALNKEIALALRIRMDTVKNHLRKVFARTGARTRTDLLLRLLLGGGRTEQPPQQIG